MSEQAVHDMIANAYSGRLATIGEDGWPYIDPLLYVWINAEIWVHNTRARGHLQANVDHDTKVCFEVDEPGQVFPYGRFECDTSLSYRSVVAFGRIRVIEERAQKSEFFRGVDGKYRDPSWSRPKDFFPRLEQVTVYAIAVERMTGKETELPATQNQWPAMDHTKTPDAVP